MPIRVLSDEVATRIAAGEVVERPASVIKELIENAIDAGASEIRLDVQGGGLRRMRVLDDGCGIPSAEVEMAFARHSTSKLASVDDLDHIHTLGFRGEALASIASVARVTLVTRVAEEPVGTLLRLEGGQLAARQPSGRPAGTAATVEDLFFNVPARRKFVRSERTERRHIDALVTRYAMAYPHLRFDLAHDDRMTFQSNGSGDLREVLVEVHGATNSAQMIKVSAVDAPEPHHIKVEGYVSAPSLHRSNRSEITLFVNGRWVQDQHLTYAVIQAYHTLLMNKRFPLAVLKVELLPEDVDVNVHPAKTQVRFRDADAVFRAVQRAVRRALVDQAPVPEVYTSGGLEEVLAPGAAGSTSWPSAWPTPEQLVRRAQLRALQPRPLQRTDRSPDTQFALDLPRRATGASAATAAPFEGVTQAPPRANGAEPSTPADTGRRSNQLPFLRIVGQLGLTYVVAEGPEGMFLIDQHAAHERILYEKFMAEKTQSRVLSQMLLEPIAVELTAEGASLVDESLQVLLNLGFDAEPFGGSTILVRAMPALLVGEDVQSIFDEIVADLQAGDEPLASEIEARIVRRVCKQAAIKAGQALSQQEMDELIRQLEACAAPRTCPHGRPTMVHLSAVELAQQFGRLG
jgi:DNA mismatch repair protein MutL